MTTQTKWTIDQSHCEIVFKVRHLMIAYVRGVFKTFDANIYTHEEDFTTADIDFWIDTSSIDTGNEDRDNHLKGPDFFNVAKHKEIIFTSSTMGKKDAEGNQDLWGELTMNGITKNVKFEVLFGGITTDPWGNKKAGLNVRGKLNRSEWELVWNKPLESGGFMVSDEVHINCDLELTHAGEVENNAKKPESSRLKAQSASIK